MFLISSCQKRMTSVTYVPTEMPPCLDICPDIATFLSFGHGSCRVISCLVSWQRKCRLYRIHSILLSPFVDAYQTTDNVFALRRRSPTTTPQKASQSLTPLFSGSFPPTTSPTPSSESLQHIPVSRLEHERVRNPQLVPKDVAFAAVRICAYTHTQVPLSYGHEHRNGYHTTVSASENVHAYRSLAMVRSYLG